MDMRQKVYLILLCTVLALMMGCTGSETSGSGSEADSIYTWENIRQSILVRPDHAFGLVDTAEMRGLADANYANWMRAQIHLAKGSKQDCEKAREYCLAILDNQDPKADSLQRVKTYHLLVTIDKKDPRTYQDAIGYAIEGAKISHEYGWTGEEAMFYFEAGETMEYVQSGSGVEYLDRSLEMFRQSSNIQAFPMFSNYLGRVARLAISYKDYARALKLTQERAQVMDRIEQEFANAPAGFVDQQRAYIYSLLAYCQFQLGDEAAAMRSAQAFENTQASRMPEQQHDILSYYIESGNSQRISQICAALEPYYREHLDTLSTQYASWLKIYAEGLDKTDRSHEAYAQLLRYTVVADSLVQRERRSETLQFAQQMKTQEKELQLKDEEAKTTIYRILAFSLVAIMFVVLIALWRMTIAHRRVLTKNRELYEMIQREQRREVSDLQRIARQPEQERTSEEQLFMRLVELMKKEQPYTDAELNRDTLAQKLGTNHRYVDEAIRECSDSQSTNAFINSYRVDHAARMLTDTSEPIALIAEMSGFANRTTFNDRFRERYKMTPSEYRQAAKR
jgi:AraC-like DNA-binding protein